MIKNSEKYIFCHKYNYLMIRIDSVLIKNIAQSALQLFKFKI